MSSFESRALHQRHPQVGAQDPERDTSPIVLDGEDLEVEPNVAGARCVFNGVGYPIGQRVQSGSEVLRCEPPGVWVREAELADLR